RIPGIIPGAEDPGPSGPFIQEKGPTTTHAPIEPSPPQFDGPFFTILYWLCIVLAAAASVVFGIWAPLSYNAAVDANRDSNAAQSAANDLASSAYLIASSANVIAADQSRAIEALQTNMVALGQLWLVDFCVQRTVRFNFPILT